MASIGSKDIKLLDFNSSRMIANKFAGEVVDVIGDTEFCGKVSFYFSYEQLLVKLEIYGVITSNGV